METIHSAKSMVVVVDVWFGSAPKTTYLRKQQTIIVRWYLAGVGYKVENYVNGLYNTWSWWK